MPSLTSPTHRSRSAQPGAPKPHLNPTSNLDVGSSLSRTSSTHRRKAARKPARSRRKSGGECFYSLLGQSTSCEAAAGLCVSNLQDFDIPPTVTQIHFSTKFMIFREEVMRFLHET